MDDRRDPPRVLSSGAAEGPAPDARAGLAVPRLVRVVLALVALLLAVVVVQAYQVLSGSGFAYLTGTDAAALDAYNRAAAVVELTEPARSLLLALAGLAAVALLTGSPAEAARERRAGAVLSGVLAALAAGLVALLAYLSAVRPPPDDSVIFVGAGRVDSLLAPGIGAVLLLALAVLLAVVLLRPVPEVPAAAAPAAPGTPETATAPVEPATVPGGRDDDRWASPEDPAWAPRNDAEAGAPLDAHELFRPPRRRDPVPEQGSGDPHAIFRPPLR